MDDDDSMILDNIDEYVNDENKVVTYKWLSLTLSIQYNKSIRLLEEYVKKSTNPLNVIYFIGGYKDIGSIKGVEYTLAKSTSLNDVKSRFDELICCHVYSIQQSEIKDADALFSVDVDITKKCLDYINKFSAIECQVPIKTDQQKKKPNQLVDTLNGLHTSTELTEVKNETRKESKKESPPLTFFNKKPSGKKDDKKSDETKKTTDVKSKSKKTDIASSFLKAKPKEPAKKELAANSTSCETSNMEVDSVEQEKEETKVKVKKTVDNEEIKHKKGKVKQREEKKEEPIKSDTSKKRKVVADDSRSDDDFENFMSKTKDGTLNSGDKVEGKKSTVLEASDEEKEEEVDVVAPTPEPVVKRKTKRRKKYATTPCDEDATSEQTPCDADKTEKEIIPTPDVSKDISSNEKVKRRGRRKVLKSKQFVNEEGYMVTQKGYESESFSEDSDIEVKQLTSSLKKTDNKVRKELEKKTKSHQPKSKHQSSMNCFFKKKEKRK